MLDRSMTSRPTTLYAQGAATLLLITVAAGCTAPPPSPITVARAPEAPGQPVPKPAAEPSPAAPAKLASVRVAVTGVVVRRGDAVEICPDQNVGPCPGIRIEGKVEDAWLSQPGKIAVWRLTGRYDGTTLVLDAPAQPTALADPPDYRNNCSEFQQPQRGVNPDVALSSTVEALVAQHADRVAANWWDRERQTMVIWVTGDPSDLRRSVAERAPGARICIQGQARYAQPELERARAKADTILRARGITMSSSWGESVVNAVSYRVEAIDARTLAEIAREAGDGIRVVAFIELLEHELEQLPEPPRRGDVALETQKTRGGGMAALGRFGVHYDRALRCVYFATPDERVLPVWPFGFWATSSPLRIYDYDDNLFAQEGDTVELGGGQVDIEHARVANPCGAKQAWFANR
jgi:hypothetical protein